MARLRSDARTRLPARRTPHHTHPAPGSTDSLGAARDSAVLDAAHLGDIRGAFGTIPAHQSAEPRSWSGPLKTLLAVIGPGLIVMVGDNDAGAFSTYTQAGQNYGTRLLWTLLLLVPVLYVNQEMVLRLGAVTGVGHARLILERFGRFWGSFSVIDLFILNALTIVTEFIGVTLAAGYLGIPKLVAVTLAAVIIIGSASTGSFRRFERISLILVAGSLLLIPIFVMVHPRVSTMARGFLVPGMPAHAGLSTVMLLIIAIVGTTVAPWQLFFQQSYVIDKRITPAFMRYERVDLWLGIVIVVVGAAAMFGFSAAAFAHTSGAGHFTSAAGVASGLARHAGHLVGVLFAIALLDASMIGAAAVGLSTAYAAADVTGRNHSLHRSIRSAKGFYATYGALIAVAAALVVTPRVPLGLLTEGVQTLAGVLLPSATVFLLLLCNDREVLGPWVNTRAKNVFAGVVIWVLIILSLVLTTSVLFPHMSRTEIVNILIGGLVVGVVGGVYMRLSTLRTATRPAPEWHTDDPSSWRMPRSTLLSRPSLTFRVRFGLLALRGYLVVSALLVAVRIIQVALSRS